MRAKLRRRLLAKRRKSSVARSRFPRGGSGEVVQAERQDDDDQVDAGPRQHEPLGGAHRSTSAQIVRETCVTDREREHRPPHALVGRDSDPRHDRCLCARSRPAPWSPSRLLQAAKPAVRRRAGTRHRSPPRPPMRTAQAFGADASRFVAEGGKRACRPLDERSRATHIHKRSLTRRRGDLIEELSVDARGAGKSSGAGPPPTRRR